MRVHHLKCVRAEPIVWECLDMSSLTHTHTRRYCCTTLSVSYTDCTLDRNDATDVRQKMHAALYALNWDNVIKKKTFVD